MKVVRYEQPGGVEVLQHVDVPDPEPGPRDVVVRVRRSALNHLDVVQRNGWFTLPGFTLPHIAGMDVAGEVVAIGSDVDNVATGQRVIIDPSLSEVPDGSKLAGMGDLYGVLGVIGANRDGGYGELCLAPATHVHRVPAHITDDAAAAFPTAYLTAWHALHEIGQLQHGETVMIHAAGSGVSVAGIQLAKHFGARVLATAGTDDKCTRALKLGADAVLNNRTGDVTAWAREQTNGVGVDMVFDHVGPALWAQSLFSIRPRGRLVSCGNTTGDAPVIPSLGYVFHMGLQILGSDPYRYCEFAEAWDVFCNGSFDTPIERVYPLAEAGAAQEQLASSAFFGKILLAP